jgi:hypothetical protein
MLRTAAANAKKAWWEAMGVSSAAPGVALALPRPLCQC